MSIDKTPTGPTPGPYQYENRYGHSGIDMRFVIFAPTADRVAVASRAGLENSEEEEVNVRLLAASWDFWSACTSERLSALEAVLSCFLQNSDSDAVIECRELLTALRAAVGRVSDGTEGAGK